MNSESEVAAYRRALEDVARFGRVLDEGEREEIAHLEALWRIEYRGDDPVLNASGEGDWARTEPRTKTSRPGGGAKGGRPSGRRDGRSERR